MPTYYSIGVSATLAVCDLQASLTNVTDLRQGAGQKADASRVQEVYSTARKLAERPTGGVVQFIGSNEDLPLYMVEAGDKIKTKMQFDCDACEAPTSIRSDSSPLTSLGATPTPTQHSFESSSPQKRTASSQFLAPSGAISEPHTLERALRTYLDSSAQALVLDIDLSSKSFHSDSSGSGASTGKSLKIEIFINGHLADVSFINARRSAVQVTNDKVRFTGTRVHRQVEKPWLYTPADDLQDQTEDAVHRWAGLSSALTAEAKRRGKDRFGDPAPSADFLAALATLQLPESVKGRNGIATVDMIITTGKGKKYGPEAGYITGPTRMDDPAYAITVTSPSKPTTPQTHKAAAVELSPYVPLRNSLAMSPTPKRNLDIAKEFGLDIDLNKTIIDGFENSRGKAGTPRTLKQRLGDLKKMNEVNKNKELDRLRQEFGANEPVKKRTRLARDDVFGSLPSIVNPFDAMRNATSDPAAILAQSRIDMALSEGAASNGHLLRRIASTSPQRTPRKHTRASSLANSPTSTPVKAQRPQGAPKTPQRNKLEAEPPLLPENGTPSRSGRGSTRTAKRWMPGEQTIPDVLKTFEVPEACRGSCVSYAEDEKVSRQIGKARNGEFREETVLVGMRFIVV